MTPRQLTYFLRIAELRSFTKAAAVLHIAQPALSRQMQQLEEDLSVRLFARSDSGVSVTEGLRVTWTLVHSKERSLGLAAEKLVETLLEVTARASKNRRWPGVALL